jgi:hypothetical protein
MTHVKSSTITNISEERNVYIFPVKVFLDFSDDEYGRNYMPTDMESHSPIPVAARSKAWGCGHSLDGNGDSNPAGCMDAVS